jgi:hypothetical protein
MYKIELYFLFYDLMQVAAAPTLKDRIPGYGVGGVREGQGGGVLSGIAWGEARLSGINPTQPTPPCPS